MPFLSDPSPFLHSPLFALPPYSTIMGNSQSQPTPFSLPSPKYKESWVFKEKEGQSDSLITLTLYGDWITGPSGENTEPSMTLLHGTSITSAAAVAAVSDPLCPGFLCSLLSVLLCTSSPTSQILLAHSGPHPPSTVSPDPCLDFSSSFDPSDHSAPPVASNPILADPVPQPPPYIPLASLPRQAQAAAASDPPSRAVSERGSGSSAQTPTPESQVPVPTFLNPLLLPSCKQP